MKEIKIYTAEKYESSEYEKVEEGVYKTLEPRNPRNLDLEGIKEEEAEEVRKLENWKKDEWHISFSTLEYNGKLYYRKEDDEKDIIYVERPREYIYVTTLSFVQEPEYDEGGDAANISQYPLEDILDKFFCFVSDFYKDINNDSSNVCFLEFASSKLKNVQKLLEIVDKHVYNKEVDGRIKLIIE